MPKLLSGTIVINYDNNTDAQVEFNGKTLDELKAMLAQLTDLHEVTSVVLTIVRD